MSTTPGKALLDHGEHRSITLGDLAALVAGIAFVLVLPTTQTYWPLPSDFLGPWPRWLPWFFCFRQALGATCVVLVPVVLRRRACYGGLARPAEFLVVFAAMPFLMDSIETALIRLSFRLQTGQTPPGFGLIGMPTAFVSWWHDSLHLVWERSFLLIGGLGIAGYVVGRRKLPGWFLTALLAVAWLTAYEALTRLFSPWVFLLIARSSGRPIGNNAVGILISAVVFLLPRFVLYSVPAAVAFREGLHGKARQTWLEWTGLALAVALFLVAEPTELIRNYSVSGSGEPWAMEIIVREAALLAAIFIGFFLAGSSRAANRRNPQFPS